jgi:hypothetical protein
MQLAEAIGGTGGLYPIRRRCPNRHRTGAVFLPDLSRHATRLDRNQVARMLHACEVVERATKAPGRRNGALGLATVAVLRCLVLRFLNRKSGLCFPSYRALQDATGFCRQTIAKALRALEAVGVLIVTRRLVRVRDDARGIVMTRQGSNVYRFQAMPALVPLPLCPAQPLKPRGFLSRVYPVDGNHRVPVQNLEQVAREVGLRGEIVVRAQPKDWRERARLSIAFNMTRE